MGYDAHEDRVDDEEIRLWWEAGLFLEVRGTSAKIHERKEMEEEGEEGEEDQDET